MEFRPGCLVNDLCNDALQNLAAAIRTFLRTYENADLVLNPSELLFHPYSQVAALQWGGTVVSIAAYANPSTLASNPRLRDALEIAGVTVISVPPLRLFSIPSIL